MDIFEQLVNDALTDGGYCNIIILLFENVEPIMFIVVLVNLKLPLLNEIKRVNEFIEL
jgi:hypothetical protein